MTELSPLFDERTRTLISEIKKKPKEELYDFRCEISKITADVIAQVAFGQRLGLVEGRSHPITKYIDLVTTPHILNGVIPYWFKGKFNTQIRC
jgi:hypothetical protein